jgi:hypothetical protein
VETKKAASVATRSGFSISKPLAWQGHSVECCLRIFRLVTKRRRPRLVTLKDRITAYSCFVNS